MIDEDDEYVAGQVIVGFSDGSSEEEARAYLEEFGLTFLIRERWEGVRAALVCVEPGREMEWITRLSQGDIVKYAELNGVVRAQQ